MKKSIVLCLLFFTSLIYAQPSASNSTRDGSISGRVMDAKLNEPLPYVNVVILSASGETITGGITDDDGKFKITKIPEGKVNVNITYIGYKTVTKEVTIGGDSGYNVKLGNINLEEEAEGLDEVTVVAEVSTIQQKVDRKVINVGKDLTTSGPTASDIMNNLPSVSVDQQSGNVSLRGNQNVQVMVDGKLSNIPAAQLLRQIPSNSIKQIELITNPSAKYNPDGLSGIINIILHKNTKIGFNGNLNVGLAYQDNPKFNSSIDMNYRNGKFNFYGNYSNNINRNENYGNLERVDDQSVQLFNFLDRGQSHLFKVGVDFYLNDKNTLSFFTNQNIFDGDTEGLTRVRFPLSPEDDNNQTFNNFNDNNSQQYNFNYKLDFAKEGHNIELEVDYNLFDANAMTDNRFFGNNVRPNFEEDTDTDRDRTTINLDYVNPLSEKSKLELGLQARLFNSTIDYESNRRELNMDATEYVPTMTDFEYTRNIYSAYATYGKTLEKWSYQVGLRAESVNVDADAFKVFLDTNEEVLTPFENDYFQVYPSAFVTYNPSEKNSYQFSYSRRVDRPGIGQVNPLPEWNTVLISSFGNQALEPQFTNSLEVNYTRQLEKGSITAGVFVRFIEDEINRAVFVDRNSDTRVPRLILTFDNFDNTEAYGIEFSSNYRPTKWWSINGSFDLYAQTQKSIAESIIDFDAEPVAAESNIRTDVVSVDNIIWNFRAFNNFRVSKSLSFSLFALYRGTNKGIQFDQKPFTFVNTGMRYNFLGGRATFNLNFNDIFNTMQFKFEGDRPFDQFGDFNWESRTVFAGLSYRFGGGKYRAKSRKRRDNDEKSGSGGFL
ncbi:TonB-dependent receptor [Winogradskyella sp. 3972H.M.0a.05]|uniref:TonB-dependent receptor domain-containing protein n=1 Tax=Winogradskyella sp. 3972H.M.0a.05 TaxID=2950277 RepID=UPI003397EB67